MRNDRLHDITDLAVDHGAESVVLSLTMRDVARRDASTIYKLHLRTPGGGFSVDVTHFERGADLQTFLTKEPDYQQAAQSGDDCSFVIAVTEVPCEGVQALADRQTDLVTVTIPRSCLDDPNWVKVGAQVYGYSKTDAQDRFTIFSDYWAPHGVHRTGFLPPFGPRVRQG